MKNTTNKKLSPEELKELKAKALDVLCQSRHILLAQYPFAGSIALRMDLIPVRDVRIRTACTDGNSIYFDIAFLSTLSSEERLFVLAHETWHAILMHLTRRGNRIPDLFNIASDKEINYMLMNDGLTPPSDLCFPTDAEAGKCAEEIYEMMLKNYKNKQKNANGSSNSSKNDGGSSSSGAKGLSGQFDKHIYDSDHPNENGDGEEKEGEGGIGVTDKYGEVGFDPDFRPSISKDFADKMRETIISEAQRCEKQRGNVPANIKELVNKILNPEISWQELLAQFVTKCYSGGTRTWIPPNRRHVYKDMYMQSRQADMIRLACIIDTSGSTMGDRSKFLTELHGLINSFGRYELTIIECDCEVGAINHYTQDDNLSSIIENGEYEMTGAGGTSMLPAFEKIIDEGIECDAILCMTDGCIDDIPTNPTGLPTLWIITKDGNMDFCDWGQKVKLKNNDND